MTANTPPPATGRDSGVAVERAHVVSVVYDFDRRAMHWCLVCHYAGFSVPPLPCPGPTTITQPPARQAGASVEALACDHGAHVRGCQSCDEDAERFIAYRLGPDWLAQRDAAVRAEVGERIASAIDRQSGPGTSDASRGAYLIAARIARTIGGDR